MYESVMLHVSYNGSLLRLTTYDRAHGKSARFVMVKDEAERAFLHEEYTCSRDLNNYLTISTYNNINTLRFTWLKEARGGMLQGFNQNLDIPVGIIARVITTGEAAKFLYQPRTRQAQIVLKGKLPASILGDKLKRHALRKAMKGCFQWDGDTVTLYPDDEDFGFKTKSGCPKNGGLILHRTEVLAKDGSGLKPKFYFGVHT